MSRPAPLRGAPPAAALGAVGVRRVFDPRAPVELGTIWFERGRVTAVLGRSGCGKSTLLALLAGLDRLRPERGEVGQLCLQPAGGPPLTWSGAPPEAALRRAVGVVFQDSELLGHLDLETNVALPRLLQGGPRDPEAVAEALMSVGLAGFAGRNPGDMSGGEQARAAILRALAHDPAVVLCDEPTSELDPGSAEGIMRLLAGWAAGREGRTVVCVTHDVSAAFRWAHTLQVWGGTPGEERFHRFERRGGRWTATQWREVAALLGCGWLPLDPPAPGRAAPSGAPPVGASPNGAPPNGEARGRPSLATLWLLARRDLLRHRRRSGSAFLQRAYPMLLAGLATLLFAVLMLGQGVQEGIARRLEADRADPTFRFTEIQARRVTPEAREFVAARLGAGETEEYRRLVLDFVEGGDYEPYVGVALHPDGEIYASLLGSLSLEDPAERARLAQAEPSDTYGGLILSTGLCQALLGPGQVGPVPLLRTYGDADAFNRTVTHRYEVLVPVLGCSPALPDADFVATLGFGRAVNRTGHLDILQAEQLELAWEGAGAPPAPEALAAALEGPLQAAFARELPGREESLTLAISDFTGSLELGRPVASVRFSGAARPALSTAAIQAAVDAAGLSLSAHFGPVNRYPGRQGEGRADRWLVPLPLELLEGDRAGLRALLRDAREQLISVDTSVVGRVQALERLGLTMQGFNAWARALLLALLAGITAFVTALDCFRKVRAFGVMSALGLRRRHYLAAVAMQATALQAAALGAALLLNLGPIPWLGQRLLSRFVPLEVGYVPGVPWTAALSLAAAQVVLALALRRLIAGRSLPPLERMRGQE